MAGFFRRVRWAVLLRCAVVLIRVCRLLRLRLPMNSFFRPHNLVKFRPYYVAPRVSGHMEVKCKNEPLRNY